MDSIAQLPRPLSGWSILGELFDDQLAAAIELLVHRLSAGIEFHHEANLHRGEPNGFQGIARRGPVSRLLLSELALADEMPEEFLRRVTQGEAGYYDVAMVEATASGRLVVLFDAGPDQLGASRIGHLATILLLWRKAERAGVALEIGTLQGPGETTTGELRDLVMWWLRCRTHEPAHANDLADVAAGWSGDDEWWVCCSELTSSRLDWPPGVEVITFEESGEGDDGATHLQVRHQARHALVPLPHRVDAIRLLRGRGFRREGSSQAHPGSEVRYPRFPGASAVLLCRTDEPDVLVSVSVPGPNHATTPRPKRRTFSGPVIAAGYIGTRTVAVTYLDHQLVVEVIGKQLSNLGGLWVPLDHVEVSESELDLVGLHAPRSLAFNGGDLYIDLPSGWWQVGVQHRPIRHPIVAAAPSGVPDSPSFVRAMNQRLWGGRFIEDAPTDGPFLIGAGYIGWGEGDEWTLASLTSDDRLTTRLERTPSGIVRIADQPTFVGLSSAGQIVRLVGRTSSTVTDISGDILEIAVHPLKPLIAVQHHDHSISVYDLVADTVVLRVRSDAT
jgi:hypothetical protein